MIALAGGRVPESLLPSVDVGANRRRIRDRYRSLTTFLRECMLDEATLHASCAYLAASLEADPTVTGIDVGYDERANCSAMSSGHLRVRVHRDMSAVSLTELMIGARLSIDATLLELTVGYSTEAGPSSELFEPECAGDGRRRRVRPLQAGLLISRAGNTRKGTLGLIVQWSGDKFATRFGLSCAHVLRPVGLVRSAAVFQSAAEGIYEPDDSDKYAGLARAHFNNRHGDAAIFEIAAGTGDCELSQYCTTDIVRSSRFARLGEPLMKSGVATGVTSGMVDGVGYYRMDTSAHLMLGFRVSACGSEPISAPMDSGSVWYSPTSCEGVGLHTGYSVQRGKFAVASHLPCVMAALGVRPAQG